MKIKIILTLFIFLYSFVSYGQKIFRQNLGDLASITFPDSPQVSNLSNSKTYIHNKPNGDLYFAQVSDLQKNAQDLLNEHVLDSVYEGCIKGVLNGTKGHLIYKKHIEQRGIDGIDFITKGEIDTKTYYIHYRAFYFNDKLISYAFWSPDSLTTSNKVVSNFFNTFKLNIKQDEIRQSNAMDIGYKAGYAFAWVITIVIIVAIGGLIVFLIKKFT